MGARNLDVDTWEATPEEMEPYRDYVGEQDSYENRPNVVGIRRGCGDGRSILLNAHIDTVDPGDPAAWKGDPLSGTVEGDLLYGRGSCDMKGGLVTHLVALDALDALGLRPGGDVTVAATVGEENGGLGALSTVLRGYRADAALITEPTRLRLVPAQGGSLVFRLKVPGRSAHAAVRDEGVSALEKFVPIFEDLRQLERERNAVLSHPLYDGIKNKVPINVGVVRAGNWASTVPESLVAEGRVGLIPGEEVKLFKDLVCERVAAVAERDPWLREHPPELDWFGGQFDPSRGRTRRPDLRGRREGPRAGHGRETGRRRRPLWRGHAPVYPFREYALRHVRRGRRKGGARPRRAHKHHRAPDRDQHGRLPAGRLVRRGGIVVPFRVVARGSVHRYTSCTYLA